MTKRELEKFVKRMDAIHARGIRRSHAIALDTIRQLEALRREYMRRQFATTKPCDSRKEPS